MSLCRDCNYRKLDTPPVAFYSPDELKRLEPLLEAQHGLFEFELDWDRWLDDRRAYLLDIGAEPTAISAALYDEEDHRFVGSGRSGKDSEVLGEIIVIRLDVDEILKKWRSRS